MLGFDETLSVSFCLPRLLIAMNRTLFVVCLLGLSFAADAALGQGGMFGPRRLGSTLRRQPSPGFEEGAGSLQGNERFIRGVRGRNEFVGVDALESPGFIGVTQGRSRGPIRSSIATLIDRSEENVNRPLPAPAGATKRPYRPRLTIGFEFEAPPTAVLNEKLTARLVQSLGPRAVAPLEVHLAGRTAILRGVVATEHDRTLAAGLALLEPGVDQVQNDLQLAPTEAEFPADDDTLPSPAAGTDSTPPSDR